MKITDTNLVNIPPVFNKALLSSKAYPHPVEGIKVLETHISWVILTGKYAYKIKKGINIGYLCTTNLDDRAFFCLEELRLNSRFAPDLYLGVAEIIGPYESATFSSLKREIQTTITDKRNKNKVIDYAVVMNQFPQNQLLKKCINKPSLNINCFVKLAKDLSHFHMSTEIAPINSPYGNSKSTLKPVQENVNILKGLISQDKPIELINRYEQWFKKKARELSLKFESRKSLGAIRECHGDLHLGNIRRKSDGSLEIFDSIDFNPSLRWIDPISELAFLLMDLEIHNEKEYANEVLNTWLEETGDFSSLSLYPWYMSYRAYVRAKVIGLECSNYNLEKQNIPQRLKLEMRKYLDKAEEIQRSKASALLIMHGLSGSGKSYACKYLCKHFRGVKICSDIERKRLCGNTRAQQKIGVHKAKIESNLNLSTYRDTPYCEEVTEMLFQEWIPSITRHSLSGGFLTIVDATFLRYNERELMLSIAREFGVKFVILYCNCSDNIAEDRISRRLICKSDPSEATIAIRNKQKSWIEALTHSEEKYTLYINEFNSPRDIISKLHLFLKY